MLRTRVSSVILGTLVSFAGLRVETAGRLGVPEAMAQFTPEGRKRTRPSVPPPRARGTDPGARRPAFESAPVPRSNPSEPFPEGLYAALLENPGEPLILTKLIEATRESDPELRALSKRLEADAARQDNHHAYAAMMTLGRLELARGNPEQARAWFLQAVNRAPERIHAHVALAELGSESDRPLALDAALARVTGADRLKLLERLRSLALERGDDPRALKYQSELTRLDPKRAGELAELYLERGQANRAVVAFEGALAKGGSSEPARLWLGLGRAHFSLKDLENAAHALERARSLGAGDKALENEVVLLEIEVAAARGALAEYAQAHLGSTRDLRLLEGVAKAFEASGDRARALEIRRRILTIAPREAAAWRGYAELLERVGELQEAREAYRSLLTIAASDGAAWVRVLEIAGVLGETARLEEDFEMALSRVETAEEKLSILDLCMTAMEAASCDRFERRLIARSRDRSLLYELGRRLFMAGHSAAARETWLKGRGPNPDGEGWSRYADLLIDHELIQEGLLAHERARSLAPTDPKIRRARALALERTLTVEERGRPGDRLALALAAWVELAKDKTLKAREREEAARHVVRLWQRASLLESETERLRERYETDPADRSSADLYVAALTLLGRLEEARQVLEALAQGAPFDPSLRTRLLGPRGGEGSDAAGRSLEVLAVVERATLEKTLRETATDRLARGKYQDALLALDRLHELRPREAAVLLLRADVLERLGRPAEAAQTVEAAGHLEPRNAAVLMRKASALVRDGRSREAGQLYMNVIRSPAGPEELAQASDALILLRAKEGLGGAAVLFAIEEPTVRAFSARPGHPGYRALLLALYDLMFLAPEPASQVTEPGTRDALERATERARMPLLSILRGGSESERAHAARLLVRIGGPESGRALLDYALSGAPDEHACLVIEGLGANGDDETARALTDAVVHEENWTPPILTSLAFALAKSRSPHAIPGLLALVRSRSASSQTLGWLGLGQGHPSLAGLPRSSSPAPVVQASRQLVLGDLERTSEGQESKAALVRGAALVARARTARKTSASLQDDPELRAALSGALSDPDPLMQGAAIRGLTMVGGAPFGPWLPESACTGALNLEDWVSGLVTRAEALELVPWTTIRSELARALGARLRGSKQEKAGALLLLRASEPSARLSLPEDLRTFLRVTLADAIDNILVTGDPFLQEQALPVISFPTPERSEARKILKAMLLGPSLPSARLAAEFIIEKGDLESITWLDEALSKNSSWSFRRSLLSRARERSTQSPGLRDFLKRAELEVSGEH